MEATHTGDLHCFYRQNRPIHRVSKGCNTSVIWCNNNVMLCNNNVISQTQPLAMITYKFASKQT